ncbi:MAG: pyruvate:ferredoxin (flavodoxin) oxidoreductase [Clostridia bacterium]|nr:pyruvate:ferredoxin (flavodoxin) oxidoreductase [Clostridia bacterium]
MDKIKKICVDGNVACAKIAYQLSEVSAIYPITPSSPMAEACDEMANAGEVNIFGEKLKIVQMQSEAGVAGAIHGSLKAGALTTTFTCSQGLLLMIPNMFKIAGELLPTVFHVTSRAIAGHALSIFGDHSDVMAVRSTGFLMLCSSSVQEAQDMALISHIASLKTSLPILHFFDGFRTSHEIQKIDEISKEQILKLLPKNEIENFKGRALNPNKPYQAGTAQNPDVYFQNKEASNKFYQESFDKITDTMKAVSNVIGRKYKPFEYYGDSNAENIIVIMGSGAETCEETIQIIKNNKELISLGKVGVLKIRVYRPFNANAFINALPKTTKRIAVLDRTKESGAIGEPLYLDVISALTEAKKQNIEVYGGRYGLGSKEFTPKCVIATLENLVQKTPKNHFTVGIEDDVTKLSLSLNSRLVNVYKSIEEKSNKIYEIKFFGLGSDGTVGANKNSIKIIGESTDKFVQGYFEYDSKKSGSLTAAHLRVSDYPIKRTYEIEHPNYIAIHNFSFLNKFDVLKGLINGGTVLLNTIVSPEKLDQNLPIFFKEEILKKKAKLYIINAQKIATELGLGNKINIIMQSAFFKTSNVIDYELAKKKMIEAVRKTYGRKGEKIVKANEKAVLSIDSLKQIDTSKLTLKIDENYKSVLKEKNACSGECYKCSICTEEEKAFNQNIMRPIELREGNSLPVSLFASDGHIPTDTAKFEKRGIAMMCPNWNTDECIQCGRCVMACPHAALRAVLVDEENLNNTPESFITKDAMGVKGAKYRIQLSPLDCTGCGVCASVCPAKEKALIMTPAEDILKNEIKNYEYSQTLERTKSPFNKFTTKGMQFEQPYFEFNGACAGCGETPYIKLATQMFGSNMVIANATGCSSIYGGSFPSCPYSKDDEGRGPAWANSLFEDNAEFGMGMSLAIQVKKKYIENLIKKLNKNSLSKKLYEELNLWIENQNSLSNEKCDEIVKDIKEEISLRYASVEMTQGVKEGISSKFGLPRRFTPRNDGNNGNGETLGEIFKNSESLYKKSVWIIGGDGWAYDIGYGGLDHVLNSRENVNILVLDSEVYSNTGGQSSKATPTGAVAKFASGGKETRKKDLAALSILSKNAYVAKISMGADYEQSIKAFREAEAYNGPSIIIAYAPCVNHGMDMAKSQTEMRDAVLSGYWDLFRYDPTTNTLTLDSDEPTMPYEEFLTHETRYTSLVKANPEKAKELFEKSKKESIERRNLLKLLAGNKY